MNLQKFSRYLFFGFLLLLPLQTVYLLREVFVGGEKWQYGSIALYGTDILLVAALVFFILSQPKTRAYYVSCIKYHVWLMLLVLWGALSIAWSDDQALAVYAAVKLLLVAGVFFLARSLSDEDAKIAIKLLVIGAVAESLLGIWQFLSQSTFASTLLGMSAHEVAEAGTSVLKGWHQRWLRAYGSLPHPNVLGGYLAAVLVLGAGYFSSQAKRQEAGDKRQEGEWSPASLISYLLSLILILFGLILTFSRSAWLGAAMGIAVYCVFRIRYRVWGKFDTQMLLILGIATIAFAGLFHDLVGLRFDSVAIVREGSVSERVQSLEDAKTVIGEGNMLLGTGAGNFTTEMMRLQPERPVWNIQPAHNVPILVFAELGLVGLVFFVIFFFSVILSAVKNLEIPLRQLADRNDSQGYGAIYIVALVALAPAFMLDHYLWTSHFGLFFFFLLLGLASRK